MHPDACCMQEAGCRSLQSRHEAEAGSTGHAAVLIQSQDNICRCERIEYEGQHIMANEADRDRGVPAEGSRLAGRMANSQGKLHGSCRRLPLMVVHDWRS